MALERARVLKVALLDHGVRTVSIEIMQGRPGTPNDRWFDRRFIGVLGHHIVSTRSMGLTPGLALIKRGRTDVPGPLANGYGGFDEVARIICMGWANHPGEGGPLALPKGTIPEDGGRPYLFGWEHEGGIRASDWTDSFRTFMGRCHAGTLDWLSVDSRSYGEHKTWAPDRKIDRLGYTTISGRAEVAQVWNDNAQKEGDMVQPSDIVGQDSDGTDLTMGEMSSRLNYLYQQTLDGGKIGGGLKRIEAGVVALGDLDETEIGAATAAALAPLLIPHLPDVVGDLDDETIARIAAMVADEQARRLQS